MWEWWELLSHRHLLRMSGRSARRTVMEAKEQNLYEQERRAKRDKLRELGFDPYGGHEAGVRPLGEIKNLYKPEMGHDGGPAVKGAGRIMLKRDMGKRSFLT